MTRQSWIAAIFVVAAALLLPADSAWLHVPDWVWVVQR